MSAPSLHVNYSPFIQRGQLCFALRLQFLLVKAVNIGSGEDNRTDGSRLSISGRCRTGFDGDGLTMAKIATKEFRKFIAFVRSRHRKYAYYSLQRSCLPTFGVVIILIGLKKC